jgi:hypothetical protein
MDRSGRGLIWDAIQAFVWRDWQKHKYFSQDIGFRAKIRTGHLPNTS